MIPKGNKYNISNISNLWCWYIPVHRGFVVQKQIGFTDEIGSEGGSDTTNGVIRSVMLLI